MVRQTRGNPEAHQPFNLESDQRMSDKTINNRANDRLFLYRGQNVDNLTADEMRDALKICIHELEQERRYKHSEKRTWNGMEIAEQGEVKTVLLSTQNTAT